MIDAGKQRARSIIVHEASAPECENDMNQVTFDMNHVSLT
jgi:hypothetical protein